MGEYKIKDLEQLTGVKAHTLRIWEKRYGIIAPQRTTTAIRTYSDEDLRRLLCISILNKCGYKISRIADMSIDKINDLVDDLNMGSDATLYFEKLLYALVEFDENLFQSTINLLIVEFGVPRTFTEFFIPFLNRIGVMWVTGSINPAQEHFITNLIRQKLIAEINLLEVPKMSNGVVILFLPESEWHELGLLFYHYVLRNKGMYTVYLGQSLPYDSLIETIHKFEPIALVTSVLSHYEDKALINYFQQIKEKFPELPLFAGGYQIDQQIDKLSSFVIRIQSIETLDQIEIQV
jgi:DNA-binding transcriptional MerR regulator